MFNEILIPKLNLQEIRRVTTNLFAWCLQLYIIFLFMPSSMQYSSMNGFNFNMEFISSAARQGSIPSPKLFLIYISNLLLTARYCSFHYFGNYIIVFQLKYFCGKNKWASKSRFLKYKNRNYLYLEFKSFVNEYITNRYK